MSSPTTLPILARAIQHHQPCLDARLAFLGLRCTISRTYNRKTGKVDLRLVWRSDEDRFDQTTRAHGEVYGLLITAGFVVAYVGTGPSLRIRAMSYYGPIISEPAPAPIQLAKVYDLATERARRAS